MSTGEGRKVSFEELCMVQDLVEECLVHYMTHSQVICTLNQLRNIEPAFTATVLQDLEEQNPEFFKSYYLRLALKEQIMEFNNLLGRQAALMNQVDPRRASFPPVFNVSHMPAIPYNGSCYVSDTGIVQKMENPHLSVPTFLVSGCNNCGPSIHQGPSTCYRM
ncbi:hypothetical protein L6452_09501 [Arctium lappa]|uniref:Uncharacterized protein n=1 Tax=Arctium lappa TaxID=4217 RepID=A0ACB9DKQ7_ARCLA|nr:hypothetical protein L6452_09501 [Arctium lappa]